MMSDQHPFDDGGNRHGIAHGTYSDSDYDASINFYKTISAVDFLTFILSFLAQIWRFAPTPCPASIELANYYASLRQIEQQKKAV